MTCTRHSSIFHIFASFNMLLTKTTKHSFTLFKCQPSCITFTAEYNVIIDAVTLENRGFDGNCLFISLEDSDLQLFFAKLLQECVDRAFLKFQIVLMLAIQKLLPMAILKVSGNWLSACEADALTDSDKCGSGTICSPRHICSFRGLVILNFLIS